MTRRWVIFSLAVVVMVTLWKLGEIPRSFYWDEAALGYYAHSLLATGADEFGKKWPLYFKSIGDYKYPAYSYLSMIPVGILGLSVFSARLLAAFSGIGVITLIIWWAIEQGWLKANRWLFLGVATLALSPWYLLFARTAREATLGLFLITLGIWGYYKKKWWLLVAAFAVSGLTYSAYRMFALLLLAGIVVIEEREKKYRKILGIVFAVLIGLMVGLTLDPQSRLRAEGAVNLVDSATQREAVSRSFEVGMALPNKMGIILARVFDNKMAVKAGEWTVKYLEHFDLSYLFASANPDLPWYVVPNSGLLLMVTLPLFLAGIWEVIRGFKENKFYQLLGWWMLVGAIPSALTIESPNPIRQLPALPAVFLIVLLGLSQILKVTKGKFLIRTGLGLLMVIGVIAGGKQFFIHREYGQPWYGNHGIKEVVRYIGEHQNEYEAVVMAEDPYIYFLFWDTEAYGWRKAEIKTLDRQWGSVAGLGKLVFLMPQTCPKTGKENVLYLCIGNKIPRNAELKFLAKFNDGEPSYALIEFRRLSELPKELPTLPDRLSYFGEVARTDSDGIIPADVAGYWD